MHKEGCINSIFQKIGYMADFEEFNPHLDSLKKSWPGPVARDFPAQEKSGDRRSAMQIPGGFADWLTAQSRRTIYSIRSSGPFRKNAETRPSARSNAALMRASFRPWTSQRNN